MVSRSDDLSPLFVSPGKSKGNWHQGIVESWDEISGSNTIIVNDQEFDDLPVLSTGAVQPYQPGDVVGIEKIGTGWYIVGKVRAVGAGAAERIASAKVSSLVAVPLGGDYADLSGSVGPSVTLYVGSARRVLIINTCSISIGAGTAQAAAFQGVKVAGASAIDPGTAVNDCFYQGAGGSILSVSSTTLLTADDGLNSGLNTFTCQYFAYSLGTITSVQVENRVLTVMPI